MAKVLVVGGAGYIGSHLGKSLSALHSVLSFDDLSTGSKKRIEHGEFCRGSLLNARAIKDCVEGFRPDLVFHLANFSVVERSMWEPSRYYYNNVMGTLHLLEALQKFNTPLIFSSSCSIYGEPQGELLESHPLCPLSPYGHSKKIAEGILRKYNQAYGLPFVVLRYFNVSGVGGCNGEWETLETRFIPRVLKLFHEEKKEESIKIFGRDYDTPDGTCIRDFVHIEDLVQAHILAMEYLLEDSPSRIFNVGSGQGYSVLEVLRMMQKLTKKNKKVEFCSRRLGDPSKLVAVAKEASGVLGWRVQHDLQSMVQSTWDWTLQ